MANVRAMGRLLEERLRERFTAHARVGDIRGRGLFFALEFVEDRNTRVPFGPRFKIHEQIKRRSLANGLAIYPTGGTVDGICGDHLIVAPPYTCRPSDIDLIIERLHRAVEEVFASASLAISR
jgi:adenosylmethionine-8-amino-7-oxononanoate aminotransferase